MPANNLLHCPLTRVMSTILFTSCNYTTNEHVAQSAGSAVVTPSLITSEDKNKQTQKKTE